MYRMICFSLAVSASLLACGAKEAETESEDSAIWSSASQNEPTPLDENADDGGTDDGTESGGGVSGGMPDKPAPFTVRLSDGTSLEFDLPTCSHYRGSSNFRTFWRKEDRTHVYVLIMEVMGIFEGAGAYSSTMGTVQIKMQQEAGGDGTGSSYNTGPLEEAEVVLTIDHLDEEVAWGSASLTAMWNRTEEAQVTVTPTTLPIWCADLAI